MAIPSVLEKAALNLSVSSTNILKTSLSHVSIFQNCNFINIAKWGGMGLKDRMRFVFLPSLLIPPKIDIPEQSDLSGFVSPSTVQPSAVISYLVQEFAKLYQ